MSANDMSLGAALHARANNQSDADNVRDGFGGWAVAHVNPALMKLALPVTAVQLTVAAAAAPGSDLGIIVASTASPLTGPVLASLMKTSPNLIKNVFMAAALATVFSVGASHITDQAVKAAPAALGFLLK